MNRHRVVVVGLGGIGSGAAYWLARRFGDGVLAVDRYPEAHERGGSEDHSRIIRLSYHDPWYVELAKRAYDAWETVEVESGEPVVLRTGGIDLAPPGAAIDVEEYRASLEAAGVDHEMLDADEVVRRWPRWRLPDDTRVLYQQRSGLVMASRANRVHRRLAVEYGATLRHSALVEGVAEHDDGVEVVVDGERHQAEHLVIASGAWTNQVMAPLGVRFPLDVSLEQVVYVRPDRPEDFHPTRFPVWIWLDEPCFYGFPVFGLPAAKIGWDRCAVMTDPDRRPFDPDPETTRTMTGFLDDRLPGAAAEVVAAKTCLYTLTPDRDFVIDRVPGHRRTFVAVGAGHAFKFASVVGRLLADLVEGVDPGIDLGPVAGDRAVLGMTDPPRSYLV